MRAGAEEADGRGVCGGLPSRCHAARPMRTLVPGDHIHTPLTLSCLLGLALALALAFGFLVPLRYHVHGQVLCVLLALSVSASLCVFLCVSF